MMNAGRRGPYSHLYKYMPLLMMVFAVVMIVGLSAKVFFILSFVFFVAFLYRIQVVYRRERIKQSSKSMEYLKTLDLNLDKQWIKDNLRGHDDLVDEILSKLGKKIKLTHPNKPLGSYFLIGPTGTGKTFLASLLSQAIFDEEPLVFHMVNYRTEEDTQNFLQTLINAMNKDPMRVVLLDEIDKCPKEILSILYPILDSGVCVNPENNEEIPFHSCLILATSNHGATELELLKKKGSNPEKADILNSLSLAGRFDKSFLARWDDFFHMPNLSTKANAEVACLEFSKYWSKFDIKVDFVDPNLVIDALTRNEPYREYGVRELSRVIQERMDSAIISVKEKGADRVKILTTDDGKVRVKVARRAA